MINDIHGFNRQETKQKLIQKSKQTEYSLPIFDQNIWIWLFCYFRLIPALEFERNSLINMSWHIGLNMNTIHGTLCVLAKDFTYKISTTNDERKKKTLRNYSRARFGPNWRSLVIVWSLDFLVILFVWRIKSKP